MPVYKAGFLVYTLYVHKKASKMKTYTLTRKQAQEIRRIRGFVENAVGKLNAHAKAKGFVINWIEDETQADANAIDKLLATWKQRARGQSEWPVEGARANAGAIIEVFDQTASTSRLATVGERGTIVYQSDAESPIGGRVGTHALAGSDYTYSF